MSGMRAARTVQVVLLLLGSAVAWSVPAGFAATFPSPEEAAQVNERTVGVVLERDERFFDLLEDIESNLSLAAGLRIVPIIGRNHVQNVYDLLYLDGVDLALVRADSIEYVRRVAGMGGTRRLTRNVARIGEEKILLIAHEDVTNVAQLSGRAVALGRPGSGELVTGTLVFESLGVEIETVEAGGERALERVRSGELAAMVHLLGSVDELPFIGGVGADGASVLELPRDERLSALYRPTMLDGEDLPNAIAAGESVPTYSVDVNLVAYAWNSGNERSRRVGRFVMALVDRLEELQGDASQPEWEEVTLEARTPNIDSSPMVAEALAEREAALERWHERRALAGEREVEAQAVLVETLGSGRAMVGRLRETSDRWGTNGAERLFGEFDSLLGNPVGATATGDGSGEWRVPEILEPDLSTPGG